MRNIKNNNGFTLVEMVVVIVIIAILSAVAIPALTGYIGKAKEKKIITETRQCVIAAQSIAIERFAFDTPITQAGLEIKSEIETLSEKPASGVIEKMLFSNAVIQELLYQNEGIYCLYKDEKYTIIDGSLGRTDYTNAKGLTGDALNNAIKENGELLASIFSPAFNAKMSKEMPSGAASWNKGVIKLDDKMGGCTFFDSDGKSLKNQVTIDLNGILQDLNDKLVSNNMQAVTQAKVIFKTSDIKAGGTVQTYETTPSYIQFKNNALTGGSSDEDIYTYNIATGEIVKGEYIRP